MSMNEETDDINNNKDSDKAKERMEKEERKTLTLNFLLREHRVDEALITTMMVKVTTMT